MYILPKKTFNFEKKKTLVKVSSPYVEEGSGGHLADIGVFQSKKPVCFFVGVEFVFLRLSWCVVHSKKRFSLGIVQEQRISFSWVLGLLAPEVAKGQQQKKKKSTIKISHHKHISNGARDLQDRAQ